MQLDGEQRFLFFSKQLKKKKMTRPLSEKEFLMALFLCLNKWRELIEEFS